MRRPVVPAAKGPKLAAGWMRASAEGPEKGLDLRKEGDVSERPGELRRFVEVPLRIPHLSVIQVETPSVDQRSGKAFSICARPEAAQSSLQQLARSPPPAQAHLPLSSTALDL